MISQSSWLFSASFFLAATGLSFHRTHLLSALLCLEGMMLSIFLSISLWAMNTVILNPLVLPLITLTLSACEAALGLALMVAATRTHGTDNLNSLNLLQC